MSTSSPPTDDPSGPATAATTSTTTASLRKLQSTNKFLTKQLTELKALIQSDKRYTLLHQQQQQIKELQAAQSTLHQHCIDKYQCTIEQLDDVYATSVAGLRVYDELKQDYSLQYQHNRLRAQYKELQQQLQQLAPSDNSSRPTTVSELTLVNHQQHLQALQQQLDQRNAQHKQLLAECQQYQQQTHQLQQQLSDGYTREHDVEQHKQRYAQLQQQHSSQLQQHEQLQHAYTQLLSQQVLHTQELEQLRQQATKQDADHKRAFTRAEKASIEQRQKYKVLQQDFNTLQQSSLDLQSQYKRSVIARELQTTKTKLKVVQDELHAALKYIANTEEDGQSQYVTLLNSKNEALQQQVQQAEDSVAQLNDTLKQRESQCEHLQLQVTEMHADQAERQTMTDMLTHRVEELTQLNGQLQSTSEVIRLGKVTERLTQELNVLNEQHQHRTDKYNKLKAAHADLHQQHQTLQSTLDFERVTNQQQRVDGDELHLQQLKKQLLVFEERENDLLSELEVLRRRQIQSIKHDAMQKLPMVGGKYAAEDD